MSQLHPPDKWSDLLVAAIDMLRRTGASEAQVRYTDDDPPVVWVVAARWRATPADAPGAKRKDHWEAAGAMSPEKAAYRLLCEVIDGGVCVHCRKGCAVDDRWWDTTLLDKFDAAVCWYRYDPELKRYRRTCE